MKFSSVGKLGALGGALALTVAGSVAVGSGAEAASSVTKFKMVRAANAVDIGCLKGAKATVTIKEKGEVEEMRIQASGLPKNTEFDVFLTQVPNAPFGMSWYQGDLQTNKKGKADETYVGRFNEETFVVAPGVAKAPVEHKSPIKDASTNPATAPVHTYHVGLWFNSPKDAKKAGCQDAVTPFNGEHNAGVQALSTRNFKDLWGPLRKIS